MEIQQRYSLHDFQNIKFNGFQFELPDATLKLINELSNEVGSPTYVKTPIFQKREPTNPIINTLKLNVSKDDLTKIMTGRMDHGSSLNKKRRGKNIEVVTNEDWETIRTFHTTKMEEKTGIEVHFDTIRSYLNKLTDKNMEEMSFKIIQMTEEIKSQKQNQNNVDINEYVFNDIEFLQDHYSNSEKSIFSKLDFCNTKIGSLLLKKLLY